MDTNMKEPIMSGAILNFFKKVLVGVEKAFRNLDFTIEKKTVDDNTGEFVYTIDLDGEHKIKLRGTPNNTAKIYDLEFLSDRESGSKRTTLGEVAYNKLTEAVQKVAADWFGIDSIDTVTDEATNKDITDDVLESAKHLSLRLKKITSATDTSINLIAVKADYNPSEALIDLSNLLSEDSVIDLVPDNDNSYEVTITDSDYECVPCDNVTCNVSGCIYDIIKLLYSPMIALQEMQFLSDIDTVYSCWIYTLRDELRFFSELYVEMTHDMFSIKDCIADCDIKMRDFGSIKEGIQRYVDGMDLNYCNFSHDVQARLDDMIRSWKHNLFYAN